MAEAPDLQSGPVYHYRQLTHVAFLTRTPPPRQFLPRTGPLWSRRKDSNLRPLTSKASALTKLSYYTIWLQGADSNRPILRL
jgi:hypothetical protein